MSTTARERAEIMVRLSRYGVSLDDAEKLRRIAMTLARWHEMECGDGNEYVSWAIERDDNGDGPPYLVRHMHTGTFATFRTKIADREKGALKRLSAVMVRYPDLLPYVQGDPRGAALHILRRTDLPEGAEIDSYYSRGCAVY